MVCMTIQMKPLQQYFCMVPFVFQYFTKWNLEFLWISVFALWGVKELNMIWNWVVYLNSLCQWIFFVAPLQSKMLQQSRVSAIKVRFAEKPFPQLCLYWARRQGYTEQNRSQLKAFLSPLSRPSIKLSRNPSAMSPWPPCCAITPCHHVTQITTPSISFASVSVTSYSLSVEILSSK